MNNSFLSVTYQSNIGKWIIKQFGVSIRHCETQAFNDFGSLFTQTDIVQIYLCVGCHEEVEVVSKHEGEPKNLLSLWDCELDFLGLLLLEIEQVQLCLSHLHRHTVLAGVYCQAINVFVYCC